MRMRAFLPTHIVSTVWVLTPRLWATLHSKPNCSRFRSAKSISKVSTRFEEEELINADEFVSMITESKCVTA